MKLEFITLAVLLIAAASSYAATYSGIIKPYMYADNLYFKQVSGTG